MAKTRIWYRNRNEDDDASSRKKRFKTRDKSVVVPRSDLNHDVLFLVMMRLGVVDFLAFSRVCKSWRSVGVSNRNRFMASQPPMSMSISISPSAYRKTICHLEDFEGRKLKTRLPHSAKSTCVGLTCGYLILYREKTRDFWLVNPITRHQLHFPNVPFHVNLDREIRVRAILVFSPSIPGYVFVVVNRRDYEMWFSTEGNKGAWNHVYSTFPIHDIHAFKGKIYALNPDFSLVFEMILDPLPKLTLLDTHFPKPVPVFEFVSSDENLYVMALSSQGHDNFHKLDFETLNWVPLEKTREECAFFHSYVKQSAAAIKPESWVAPSSQYARFSDSDNLGKGRLFAANDMWYFPHDCLNVSIIKK